MKKKAIITSIFIIIVCSFLAIALFMQQQKNQVASSKVQPKAQVKVVEPKPLSLRKETVINKKLQEKITIGAIGDILVHEAVYKDAFDGHHYNFDPMFANVKSLLQKPDVLTANQESTLGGIELGLSTYPTFNSPHEVANALVHTGVDIVSTANNHSLDKGEKGIDSEMHYLNSIGLPHVGSFMNEQDREKLRILDKNGIKIAFLAYSYGTNGIPIPDHKDFLVNLINRNIMHKEIQRAKKAADVVVMSIHWGIEYQRVPNEEQKELASFLANEGVDVIFGSHPHVLQPMDWITRKDGKKTFVIYSLGNFLSGQDGEYKTIGGMATIDITKNVSENGNNIILSNPVFYPTFVSSHDSKHFRVVPLEKAGTFGLANAKVKYQEIQKHMKQWLH